MPLSKTRDEYQEVIEVLNRRIWDGRLKNSDLELWLGRFSESERPFALHLLAHFTFLGHREIREMLRTLYRDMIRYPIIQSIRRRNNDTLDRSIIEAEFARELECTRFLGVGNPSESGTHLLYYFRQENNLPKKLFINTHEIFDRSGPSKTLALRRPAVKRYVFIDDLCGSGSQAAMYSRDLVEDMKSLDNHISVCYFALLGMEKGLEHIRTSTVFSEVESLFVLDDSFRCFDPNSRYYLPPEQDARVEAEQIMTGHGSRLEPDLPLGYNNGQLLLGFFHNIPDNTLPIIWSAKADWTPVFRRYDKKYK